MYPRILHSIRRKGVLAPVGGEVEDPLGLDVESSGGGGFPEEQLQVRIFNFVFSCLIPRLPGDVPRIIRRDWI